MGVLHAREEAFENEYFHRVEVTFLKKSRRTRLFALDLADAMGMEAESAEGYSAKLLAISTESRGDDDVLVDQVLCDLHDIGIVESREIIVQKLYHASVMADKLYSRQTALS